MQEMLIRSPSIAFAFGVQTLHSSERTLQGRLRRPIHRPSYAEAHSGGTLPVTSRASPAAGRRCLCGDWHANAPPSCASRVRAAPCATGRLCLYPGDRFTLEGRKHNSVGKVLLVPILAQADGTGTGEWAMHPLAEAKGLSRPFSVKISVFRATMMCLPT